MYLFQIVSLKVSFCGIRPVNHVYLSRFSFRGEKIFIKILKIIGIWKTIEFQEDKLKLPLVH